MDLNSTYVIAPRITVPEFYRQYTIEYLMPEVSRVIADYYLSEEVQRLGDMEYPVLSVFPETYLVVRDGIHHFVFANKMREFANLQPHKDEGFDRFAVIDYDVILPADVIEFAQPIDEEEAVLAWGFQHDGAEDEGYDEGDPDDVIEFNYAHSTRRGYAKLRPRLNIPDMWALREKREILEEKTAMAIMRYETEMAGLITLPLNPPGVLVKNGEDYWFLTDGDYDDLLQARIDRLVGG